MKTTRKAQPLRVLIADDVAVVRYTLALDMKELGWEVTEAGSGEEAIDILGTTTFDILVTDIWMPRGDGISVIKAVRKKQPAMRIFAISGGGPGMSLASANALAETWGAEKLLIKPFDVRELIEAINTGRAVTV